MGAKFQAEVFWTVTACSVAVGYQGFGEPCCLLLQGEDGGSLALQNVGILPQHVTPSQTIRLLSENLAEHAIRTLCLRLSDATLLSDGDFRSRLLRSHTAR